MKALLLPICVAATLLGACNKQPAPAQPAAAPEASVDPAALPEPAPPVAQRTDAISVAADAVTVGSAQGADQSAISPKPAYAVGDTVYASASTRGPAGATAHVYWTFQDGTTHKEEEKPVTDAIVSFAFSQADGMTPGTYNVQIDLNDLPVGIADFTVQ